MWFSKSGSGMAKANSLAEAAGSRQVFPFEVEGRRFVAPVEVIGAMTGGPPEMEIEGQASASSAGPVEAAAPAARPAAAERTAPAGSVVPPGVVYKSTFEKAAWKA